MLLLTKLKGKNMSNTCKICGSHAINEGSYDRERGVDSDLCDVHYWKKRADKFKWQSIETAPRDKSFLAVTSCGGDSYVSTMRWSVAHETNARKDNKEFHIERVTHWMEIPEKP